MSKVFVLRTHALLSSRGITQKFGDDNTIVVPMVVVDELRKIKKESFEKGRIARDFLEYLNSFPIDELMSEAGAKQNNGSYIRVIKNYSDIPIDLEGLTNAEKRTLQTCKGIIEKEKRPVILVTNNLSLQLKSKSIGIKAESFKDEVFPKLSQQYTGRETVYTRDDVVDAFYANGFINVEDIFDYEKIEFVENKFFVINPENKSALAIYKNGKLVKLNNQKVYPYGITPKNVGQKFMLEALLDENYPLVVIKGSAGTGKTFCTLAAGLQETMENQSYSRILVTRSVTASEQYGFLPGDIEEKLSPYLAGIKDNLSILTSDKRKLNSKKTEFGKKPEEENGEYYFERGIVQIQAIGFLRGRSIVDTYFIIDETQNIEPDVIKSIVTRAAEGSKFIFLGDPTQIDNPNLTERNNGLVYLSEKMKGNPLCAQVSLYDDESVRSELAKQAAQIL